jgi:hypothetical protein
MVQTRQATGTTPRKNYAPNGRASKDKAKKASKKSFNAFRIVLAPGAAHARR